MIQLSKKWAAYLKQQPESGMGWQIASIILNDGTKYEGAIIDSGFITSIKNIENIPFEERDISQIIVTKNSD